MKPRRRTFILGGDHTPFIGKFHPDFIWKKHPDFGKRENPNIEEYIKSAALKAFEATGVQPVMIDKAYVGNFVGELFANQGHLNAVLASAHPDLVLKPIMRVEGACASGALAMVAGIDAVQAGNDLVLVVGAEVQTTASAVIGADYLARAAHYRTQREIDPFSFPCIFARKTKLYMEKYGLKEEELALVVHKAYENANRNPYAHMRARKLDLEFLSHASDKNPNFLSNPEYKRYLKVTDCSQVSDGGSAFILGSEEGLKRAGRAMENCIEILAYGHTTGPIEGPEDPTWLGTTHAAAKEAYRDAAVGPNDIQIAEVHDCFVINEVMSYEALGFAEQGKGVELAKERAVMLGGRLPVNTGGGLMGFGHPVGTTGVKQAVEIYRQMKGLCGDYQVDPAPTIGLTSNMGGDDRTSVVTIYRNC
jgi:acetyl-CoA acyltransferase